MCRRPTNRHISMDDSREGWKSREIPCRCSCSPAEHTGQHSQSRRGWCWAAPWVEIPEWAHNVTAPRYCWLLAAGSSHRTLWVQSLWRSSGDTDNHPSVADWGNLLTTPPGRMLIQLLLGQLRHCQTAPHRWLRTNDKSTLSSSIILSLSWSKSPA